MSQYLHVQAFTNRPSALRAHLAAHAINPALQPTPTRIPALTLTESYELGHECDRSAMELRAAQEVLGNELGAMVHEDARLLQEVGLDRLGGERLRLRDRYARFDHAGAGEIVAWLDGEYCVSEADVPGPEER